MFNHDQQPQQHRPRWHADCSILVIWLGLILLAVAVLPFVVRNSEIVGQVAAMCGFTLN